MPWRVKWELYMIALGSVLIIVAIAALVLAAGVAMHLLAIAAAAGGIATLLNAMPHNGNGDSWRDYSGERGPDKRR